MADYHSGTRIVRRFADLDLWLGHAVQGRSKRHQLLLGKPGKGKTARLHRHVRNTIGHDLFPKQPGRVAAPIYSGRITPAKWFVRGWQHHLEPLLCLNDVSIRRVDEAWESMLCQFLEFEAKRTIRWDIKGRMDVDAEDRENIIRYLRRNGLLERFLREQRRQLKDDRESWEQKPVSDSERFEFRQSLPELDDFEDAYGGDEEEDDAT